MTLELQWLAANPRRIVRRYKLRLREFSLVHARHSTRYALNQGTTRLFGPITHCGTPALREILALSCNMRARSHVARDRRRTCALTLVLPCFAAARCCLFQGTVCACAISRWFMHATARDASSTMATAMLFGPVAIDLAHRDAPALRENLALSCNMRANCLPSILGTEELG